MNTHWTQSLLFYGCFSCGRYFASADEIGTHIKVQIPEGAEIRVIQGEPFRTRQKQAYAQGEVQKLETEYWEGIRL